VLHITCAILFDKASECLFLLLLWDSKNYASLGRQQTTFSVASFMQMNTGSWFQQDDSMFKLTVSSIYPVNN
jgi:hypothetical protein